MEKEKLGFLVTLISAAGFGSMAIFAKIAYSYGLNITTILVFRFCIAVLILWLYIWFKKEYVPVERKTLWKLILVGTLGYGLVSVFYFNSVKFASASLAGILLYLHPLLVYLVLIFLKRDFFAWNKAAALVVSFLGLLFVLGSSFSITNYLGLLAGLGSAFAYTFYIVAGDKVIREMKPIQGTAIVITSSAVAYLIFGLLSQNIILPEQNIAYLWMTIIAVFSTVIAIALFWVGVSLIGPTNASIVSTFEPFVTVILAFVFIGEKLTTFQSFGGLLIIGGVVILKSVK